MFRSSVLAAFALAGCLDPSDAVHTGDPRPLITSCDAWACGTNSPKIAQLGFWELQVPGSTTAPGQANNVGFRVHGFKRLGGTYLPRVRRGRLVAMPTVSMFPFNMQISGVGLVGGYFDLRLGTRQFRLRVGAVSEVRSWAQPAVGHGDVMLESYLLEWTELVEGTWREYENVCSAPPGKDDLGMTNDLAFHTLLFEGDRINADKKQDDAVDISWFNLGCAGSALAKLALTGHTEASKAAHTFTTTLAERQAMLKLLTADYCGDGKPFTVAGQPLRWADDDGTMALMPDGSSPASLTLEARWTANGAACLSSPRVDVHWTQLGADVFGDNVYAQVAAHCGAKMPPLCNETSYAPLGYHLVSATPPFQPE